jgi:hypothetical protein
LIATLSLTTSAYFWSASKYGRFLPAKLRSKAHRSSSRNTPRQRSRQKLVDPIGFTCWCKLHRETSNLTERKIEALAAEYAEFHGNYRVPSGQHLRRLLIEAGWTLTKTTLGFIYSVGDSWPAPETNPNDLNSATHRPKRGTDFEKAQPSIAQTVPRPSAQHSTPPTANLAWLMKVRQVAKRHVTLYRSQLIQLTAWLMRIPTMMLSRQQNCVSRTASYNPAPTSPRPAQRL